MEEVFIDTPRRTERQTWTSRAKSRVNRAWKLFKTLKRKPEIKIACHYETLLMVLRDIHYATMAQWDFKSLRLRDSLRTVEYDQHLTIQDDRYVMWWSHNVENNTYTVIHCQLESEEYEAYWFASLPSGICYLQSNMNDETLKYLKCVVIQPTTMLIFSNWTCLYCTLLCPGSELSCTSCQHARYGRCTNPECELACLKGQLTCRRCQWKCNI